MNLFKLHTNPAVLNHYDEVYSTLNEYGTRIWYKNGEIHRDGDLPAIVKDNNEKMWYKDGKSWRENDKPSVEAANGSLFWYDGDELHRETGPAAIYSNGKEDYYLNDRNYEKADWERMRRR